MSVDKTCIPSANQHSKKSQTPYPLPKSNSLSIQFFPSFRLFSPRASAHSPHDTTPQYHLTHSGSIFLVPTKTNPNQTPSSFSHKNKNITKIKLTSFLIFQRTSLNYLSYFVEIQHHPPLSKTSNQSL